MEESDVQLVSAYLGGDDESLKLLIGRHLKPVLNFVYRFTGGVDDAEDITQEVFVKVWKHIKTYESNQSFRAWLFRIARNTSIDWLRKKRHIVFSEFDSANGDNVLIDTLADPAPLADELIAKAHDKAFLDRLLAGVSPDYRTVLFLHYNDHMTFDEIGQVLNKPLDTVKSQHRRALIKLRLILANAPDQQPYA